MTPERLQKVLARAGVASRRACEQLIAAGRVRVNGRIADELGTKVDTHKDKIELDGRRIVGEKPCYYLLHKPREVVTTMDDPEGRTSVASLVDRIPERIYPVGRLDYHTSGALLLTNDGAVAHALLHPRRGVPKTYVAKVRGAVQDRALASLLNGVELDDGTKTRKAHVFVLREDRGNTWLQLSLSEGKNRQVHRMCEAVGHPVMRLSRPSFADLTTDGLRPGEYRPLTAKELDRLKRDYLNPSRRSKSRQARAAPTVAEPVPRAPASRPSRRPTQPRKPGRSQRP